MNFEEIIIAVPCYDLEDLSLEMSEEEAENFLNCFAIAWHPELILSTGLIPKWMNVDELPYTMEQSLVILPDVSTEWLAEDWYEQKINDGAVLVRGGRSREEIAEKALREFPDRKEIDSEILADFYALGSCYLQLELLTKYMYHYSSLDESRLQYELISAAEAALQNDAEKVKEGLNNCFEVLLESRERFYPVDCYILDLCLVNQEMVNENLEETLNSPAPVNLMFSGETLDEMEKNNSELVKNISDSWNKEDVDVVGGEYWENQSPLLPFNSLISNFQKGASQYRNLLGKVPNVWGRKRFGLSRNLPQILCKHGFRGMLHFVIDDGIYPDEEQSRIRWEGKDGSVIDGVAKIPLAIDSASGFLQFARRLSESMGSDVIAAVVLARWPEVKTPWLEDLHRINKYAPVLGRFVTFNHYYDHVEDPGRLTTHDSGEYFSPFLIQSVAAREVDPVSRFVRYYKSRGFLDSLYWSQVVSSLISGKNNTEDLQLENLLEERGVEDYKEESFQAGKTISETRLKLFQEIADLFPVQKSDSPGYFVFNPLSFKRLIPLHFEKGQPVPIKGGAVKTVQSDDRYHSALIEVPGCGFVWIPASAESVESSQEFTPLVNENVISNEFIEVHVNQVTGGISKIKEYGRKPNRISQQISFRFPEEITYITGENESLHEENSFYAQMKMESFSVNSVGPSFGEIETKGVIVHPKTSEILASYRQIIRLWRGKPIIEIKMVVSPEKIPEGNPWGTYFACRFAWNDSAASLSRSVQESVESVGYERIESPHYLEIASDELRTTLLFDGMPFHRKTGMRTVDSILICEGETEQKFQVRIAIDATYPMQAAYDSLIPAAIVPSYEPADNQKTGWFFHVNKKNVLISQLKMLEKPGQAMESSGGNVGNSETPEASGNVLRVNCRLIETEGQFCQIKLQTFRKPVAAWKCDFNQNRGVPLVIMGDVVLVDLDRFEVADIELEFSV
jgi:alpha-mannosidase